MRKSISEFRIYNFDLSISAIGSLILSALGSFININNRLLPAGEASLPPDNRAFRYGYGLFETMLVRDGHIQLATLHWQRLFAGMRQLLFILPKSFTPEYLEDQVIRTLRKNKLEALCRVRLQVYAGSGGLFEDDQAPGIIIECFPLDEVITQLNEHGLVAGIARGIQKSADSLANLKSCNSLIYAMAARQARSEKWNDALICNTDGHIIESAIANIFWVKKGVIYTPPLEEGCVAGVMRQHLLSRLNEQGYTVIQTPLLPGELEEADEAFLTNSIRKIKWINEIGDVRYHNNLTKELGLMMK